MHTDRAEQNVHSASSSSQCDRRAVILGAGKVAAAGVAATLGTLTAREAHAEGVAGQECMTIIYQNGDGVRFDFDYYEKTHMHNIMRAYGKSIARFELRRGLPGADGARPPYVATITIWIADPAAFDAAAAQHQAALRADVSKFTNATLIAQRDKIVAIAV
ncbi:MAG TPA: EthD family reductase [Gammaproteobacteria bacterium]|nr:EthD family reductase [Gammaproteobacteria bacterium]